MKAPDPRDVHLIGGGLLAGLGVLLWAGLPQALVAWGVYFALLGRPWK